MFPLRRTVIVLALLTVTFALAACAGQAASPSPSADASPAAVSDLNAIACATDHPEHVGDLTGAWAGDDDGVYYIRQVGDCVWWFGTGLVDIEPGQTGQQGWSNVAAGRVNGTQIEMEWADVPVGEILGGGGLTLTFDEADDQLVITGRRGDWGFGATTLTRITDATPDASPSESATS